MRRTSVPRALAALAAGASLVATLSACAAKPQDSNTSNGITPGPPPPSGISLDYTLTPQPTKP
jgi:hypothetical protein